jgi:hypothetical protein
MNSDRAYRAAAGEAAGLAAGEAAAPGLAAGAAAGLDAGEAAGFGAVVGAAAGLAVGAGGLPAQAVNTMELARPIPTMIRLYRVTLINPYFLKAHIVKIIAAFLTTEHRSGARSPRASKRLESADMIQA